MSQYFIVILIIVGAGVLGGVAGYLNKIADGEKSPSILPSTMI
jgi:hypothetical protein